MPTPPQLEAWEPDLHWHETIRSKLTGLLESNQFNNFSKCGKALLFKTCTGCHTTKTLSYRCSIKWCPLCNWRRARERASQIRLWASEIHQAKHVVLTQRNFPVLTRRKLKDHVRCLSRLRRTQVMRDVKGGCISVEITNEGKGWHLHSHWLVDARWIDASKLAVAWGEQVGQEFGIVKVMDAREQSYAHEVAKYVVKGAEMARWPGEHMLEFVLAVKGCRFFFTFGSLSKARARLKATLEAQKPEQAPCACGCGTWVFETEERALLNQLKKEERRKARR